MAERPRPSPVQVPDMSNITIEIQGHTVAVSEGPYAPNDQPNETARKFASELIAKLDDMRKFIAKEKLELYNEEWREDDDPVLSEADFTANLVSPSIVLYDELGAACIYFEDSDMFGGHSIEVSVHENKIVDSTLVG